MAKVNMVRDYLDEVVNYGGIPMTRGQMIRELTVTAKATGRENWQVLVNIYLAGHARKIAGTNKQRRQGESANGTQGTSE